MPAFVLASLVSDDEDPDKFIWLEFWDLATPPTEKEGGELKLEMDLRAFYST